MLIPMLTLLKRFGRWLAASDLVQLSVIGAVVMLIGALTLRLCALICR